MKRHKSLYPLSHDHHHALVQAKNLRIAAKNADDKETLRQVAMQTITYWSNDLCAHFRQEEVILLPVFARHTTADHPEIVETLRQHDDIRAAVDQLKNDLEQAANLAVASQTLADQLSQHIRYEEQRLFPLLQEVLPEEALWEIHHRLTTAQGANH
ncbi:hemerythrin HHE cation binding domain-containing protein [Nitrosomonas nitrosa]|jgi:iron-sulfur cluster repair protein YtfE (RIC family)|uniref:Hemerythrin HHE cation binding domain-containing protein n=1 Tax=Nitrosomonas nitrosa TaxID=52442 RepID=A0A1I4MTK3_9PROT|nr:hemerythrin domain-containing protein [Nitrosomonas nitrosa]MCO6434697.1 hemerythrin domain-containing protein [Nitrosomonas nitrosa]PTR02138.1 hemerythrin HHE cation binding domain-containing protein [Nitrosomonas nitrosa]SFM06631.1 Hemerythrin HHE cation binding domain-containing protein [Nitrosomonas nitrosa]